MDVYTQRQIDESKQQSLIQESQDFSESLCLQNAVITIRM